ncbi:hypothetical protein D9758_001187 [Tetrapyrgos nigripes]|uniref:Ubiquitin-like domain-containing protein n=1 Tax=Tetrapyrgos nigripes TaxID=182062 RepID=A0A8H5GRU0_9AGAR|nr:hypothetical protein D9758_001187 [Tetrapyrgos nigripes]
MSIVQVRIELPTYAHSFLVSISSDANVLQLKQEISKSCAGAPRVDGQRIIWRGRYLSDSESLESLWKSPDESRIVHLSVHPSAWTASPPTHHKEPLPNFSQPAPAPAHLPSPTPTISLPPQAARSQPVTPQPSQSPNHLAYVAAKHRKALSVLMQRPLNLDDASQSDEARTEAIQLVERNGYTWPPILDEPYPPPEAGGVRYEVAVIDGQRYLNLQDPTTKPTPAQLHALNVLSYTLALLKLPTQAPPPTNTTHSQPVELPPHINALLQQMGLPHLNAIPNQHPIVEPNAGNANVVIEAREIQMRPLILPLVMLMLRTVLLLYFVAPARKPVFGILILVWVLYEIWRPIRNALARLQRAAPADRQDQQNAAGAGVGNPPQGANPAQPNAAVPGPQPVPAPGADIVDAAAILDTLANYDIQEEESALTNGGPEPGLGRKAAAFVTLLLSTVHPAIWNRRRALLRRREGRIRTEANTMEAQDQGEDEAQNNRRAETRRELLAQHARRPLWVQNYIARVVREDWIDDSD